MRKASRRPRKTRFRGQRVNQLVMMAKAPVVGTVKTRLANGVGSVQATYFYRHMVAALLARIGMGRQWQTWIAIAPDIAVAGRHWPANVGRVPQGGGDLGQRMQRVLDRRPAGAIVIIGTDCPAIRQSDIATAFRALGANSVVIGPSPDGGYWLIGAQRTFRRPKPFGNVRWSSADALSDTLRNLSHVSVAKLRILTDVDTETEWRACRAWAGRCVLPADVERQSLCSRLSNS